MRRTLACVLAGLTLLSCGCSGSDDDPTAKDAPDEPALSEQIAELDAAPKVRPPDEPRPDRDPDAVTAALWRLDPCVLIAPHGGQPGSVDSSSPHECSLVIGHEQVTVKLGQRLEPGERYGLEATGIAGARAYVLPGDAADDDFGCRAWLPVSFEYAIELTDTTRECGRVRGLVKRAVERIDAPTSVQRIAGLGDLDTCKLLDAGLGQALQNRQLVYGASANADGVDDCAAAGRGVPTAAIDSTEVVPVATLKVETYGDRASAADEAAQGRLGESRGIEGRRVVGTRVDSVTKCILRWAEGIHVLEVRTTMNCARGRAMVRRIVHRIDGSAKPSATPREDLLYDADEPDHARRGPCVDYMPLWFGSEYTSYTELEAGPTCHPYAEPDVPDDPAAKVVAAEADPNVTCAIATDAVRAEFGESLQPATLDPYASSTWRMNPTLHDDMSPPLRVRPCVYVDRRQRVQLQIFISADGMALQSNMAESLEQDDFGMRTPIGAGAYGAGNGFMIGLGEEPDDPGYVAVFAGRHPQRTSTIDGYDAMAGAVDRFERVADSIVDDQLSGEGTA